MSQKSGEEPPRTDPRRPAAHPPAPGGTRTGFGKVLTGLAATLSIGPRKKADAGGADVGTQLAHERTDLAVERNYLAAERTLMAWIRTALSMISFGFTIGKLGQTLANVEVKGVFLGTRMVGVESIAYFLVVLGTAALAAAIWQYLSRAAEYAAMGLRRRISVSVIVGLVLVLVGGFALTDLVLQM